MKSALGNDEKASAKNVIYNMSTENGTEILPATAQNSRMICPGYYSHVHKTILQDAEISKLTKDRVHGLLVALMISCPLVQVSWDIQNILKWT